MCLAKSLIFIACLVPLGGLIFQGLNGTLGANPIEHITHTTGDWTLRFLLITLAVTPARRLLGRPELIKFRRMLGLFAFFYGCLHFLTWIGVDQFFDWASMMKDVRKRPFITVGFTGFVLLVPLAITSTKGWIRSLGGKNWRMLHRLIYVSAVAGVVHYWWLVKSDITRPAVYGSLVAALLGYRLVRAWPRPLPRRRPVTEAVTEPQTE